MKREDLCKTALDVGSEKERFLAAEAERARYFMEGAWRNGEIISITDFRYVLISQTMPESAHRDQAMIPRTHIGLSRIGLTPHIRRLDDAKKPREPLILAHRRTKDGTPFQLRRDPHGVL